MKALILILLATVMISGCNTTTKNIAIKTNIVVIKPPKTLLNCPQIGKVPNPDTLTNQQVADFVAKLYKYNRICGINMDQIKSYIEKTEKQAK